MTTQFDRGRIFEIESDYQVGERAEPFNAVGCGQDLALGALYAAEHLASRPRARIELSLAAAANFSAGVYPPFRIEELTPNTLSTTKDHK